VDFVQEQTERTENLFGGQQNTVALHQEDLGNFLSVSSVISCSIIREFAARFVGTTLVQ
jgi:hypothetical protein